MRRIILLSSTLILILAAGWWVYSRSTKRTDISKYVPATALGYLEINDWPRLLGNLSSTKAWQELAPVYGVNYRLENVGRAGWLASLTGYGEAATIARTQIAIVVTGIEVRGDEVKPRFALVAETNGSHDELRKIIEKRLPEFVRNIYGKEIRENSEYGGISVTGFLSGFPERQILSAQIDGEWIVANHPDPLRACIDTRLGRAPSIAGNFHLQNSRPVVDRNGEVFGFITGEGVTRLLRFGAFLISSNALRETPIIETLQDVLSDLTARASDGIAYGSGFENGSVVDRYAMLFKPDLVESLTPIIKINPAEIKSFDYVPSSAKEVAVINVDNPEKTLSGIERAVSARIGAGQSFILNQLLIGARGIFPGMRDAANSAAVPGIGNEITSYLTSDDREDKVWLIAVNDRGKVRALAEKYLTLEGATTRRAGYAGLEIIESNNPRRGSAVFIDSFLAFGKRPALIRLIDARRDGKSLRSSQIFANAHKPDMRAAMVNLTSVNNESGEMMSSLSRLLGGSAIAPTNEEILGKLPYAASSTSLNGQGIYTETYSPFGNFPFFVSLADGAMQDRSRNTQR